MPVDGGLFDLHGAMVAEGVEDGEGDLLEAIREVMGPDRPIFVTLDLHCNITPQMAANADVIIPCDNFPHTDLAERGREAADLIVRTLRGEIRPTMSWTQLPQLWVAGQFTGLEPFKSIIGRAHELEAQPGILTASVAPGFTWADIEHAGSSVIVIADGDQALADRESRALGEWVFAQREHFDAHMVSFDQALRAARARDSWPAVISDPQDNPGAGTPGDSTGMLRAFIEADLQNALLACVWDPDVAAVATAAGVGAEITVEVGGKSIASQGAGAHDGNGRAPVGWRVHRRGPDARRHPRGLRADGRATSGRRTRRGDDRAQPDLRPGTDTQDGIRPCRAALDRPQVHQPLPGRLLPRLRQHSSGRIPELSAARCPQAAVSTPAPSHLAAGCGCDSLGDPLPK